MNRSAVNRIANAVLYEGYILYPYRPSTKNRQRWTFGGLYPEAYCPNDHGESSFLQTEILIRADADATFEAVVRFLHLTARQVGEISPPLADWPAEEEPEFQPVESLRIGDHLLQTWQEAEEREVPLEAVSIGDLLDAPAERRFSFAGGRHVEGVRDPLGPVAGVLLRTRQAIQGVVEVSVVALAGRLFRIRLRVQNLTPCPDDREAALVRSFASTHVLLGVHGGEFLSLADPPPDGREAAAGCRNTGGWPVLVGEEGTTDTALFSPIILSDYPQIAPESPGDFFDGTEIDEMLTLRILTLTDEEKRAMATVDARTGELLARTETRAREQLLSLHGTVRGWHPSPDGGTHG